MHTQPKTAKKIYIVLFSGGEQHMRDGRMDGPPHCFRRDERPVAERSGR